MTSSFLQRCKAEGIAPERDYILSLNCSDLSMARNLNVSGMPPANLLLETSMTLKVDELSQQSGNAPDKSLPARFTICRFFAAQMEDGTLPFSLLSDAMKI